LTKKNLQKQIQTMTQHDMNEKFIGEEKF